MKRSSKIVKQNPEIIKRSLKTSETNETDTLRCLVFGGYKSLEGHFVRLIEPSEVKRSGVNSWFAVIIVSGKKALFNLDKYSVKIL